MVILQTLLSNKSQKLPLLARRIQLLRTCKNDSRTIEETSYGICGSKNACHLENYKILRSGRNFPLQWLLQSILN